MKIADYQVRLNDSIRDRLAELMGRIVSREVEIFALWKLWDEEFCGEIPFITSDGWYIRVFKDCGDVDYLDSCITPAGERWDFDALHAIDENEQWPNGCVTDLVRSEKYGDDFERVVKQAPLLSAVIVELRSTF